MSLINPLAADLDKLDWVGYDCYDFLGCQVILRSNSEQFIAKTRGLLRSFPSSNSQTADLTFSFIMASPSNQTESVSPYRVYRNNEQIGVVSDYWQLFRLMEWQLDIFLSENVRDYFLLHAGVVAHQGRGIILPATSGSGKSSLTLALMLQGYHYLSDELAVINPQTGELKAFPKPFSLKNLLLFPTLTYDENKWLGPEPEVSTLAPMNSNMNKPVWYVHADDLKREITFHGTVPIRYIFFPNYRPDASPHREPLSAGQAMRQLLDHCVNFPMLGQGGLSLLGRLVAEAQCFSLIVNGPEATTQLITELL